MLSVTVHLPTETERRLREKAAAAGLTLEGYLGQLAERDAGHGAASSLPAKTFEEILAPVREEALRDPMSDEEISALVQEARAAVWQQKQARKNDA